MDGCDRIVRTTPHPLDPAFQNVTNRYCSAFTYRDFLETCGVLISLLNPEDDSLIEESSCTLLYKDFKENGKRRRYDMHEEVVLGLRRYVCRTYILRM